MCGGFVIWEWRFVLGGGEGACTVGGVSGQLSMTSIVLEGRSRNNSPCEFKNILVCVSSVGNGFCFPRKNAGKKNGEEVTFHEAIDWILDQNPADIDGHWKLQSEHCNLRSHINDYTIIGRMEKDTHSSDASCIMEKAGINRFNKQNSTSTEPFWKEHSKMTIAGQHYRQESEVETLKKLYSPTMARALMDKMKQDYEILKLPEPSG